MSSYLSLQDRNRRTVRGPVNPNDKATVVSIYPREINEVKPTIQPGYFHIPPGTAENPSVLVVGPSSWWREIDYQQPLLEIPNSSVQVADSIVKDYCNGLLACNMTDAMPGLFYVVGELTSAKILLEHKKALQTAIRKQKNWFVELVKMADVLWARSNGNPLTISDDMRLAAEQLGLNNKDWMKNNQAVEMVRCEACGALRNPLYPVCGSCHAIVDKVRAKELNLTFAQ